MIKITVPATSANLGIGYDTLGMAVGLYSHFTFERADKLTITGCPKEFQNENNLVYVSFVDALAAWGEPAFPVAIDIQTDVPVARGLGSSSTCVVAGIMAAAALTGHTVDCAELVRIAIEVEGHPDNVAPAILGGAVCSFTPTDSLPQCLRYEVSDRLRFITVIPPYEVHTSEARKVVPQEIPLSTAVWQMGRIAGMTRGLETGDLDLIAAANDDRIQEPYRRRLIPDYNAVRDTYDPKALYASDERIRRALDTLIDGTVETDDDQKELYTAILEGASWHRPDNYFILRDFESYREARLHALTDWKDRVSFGKKCLYNIAAAGMFSSDRAIRQYAETIWELH